MLFLGLKIELFEGKCTYAREKCCTQETFNAKFRCKITFLFPRTLSSIDKAVSHVSCEKVNLFLAAAQSTIKFN